MDPKNDENQSEETILESHEDEDLEEISQGDEIQSDDVAAEDAEKKPPSRMNRFFRKALVWFVVIVIAFLAGFLTDHFLRYQPLADTLEETQSRLVDAEAEVSDLEAENARLETEVEDARDQIASLEEALEIAVAKSQYFQVLMDINNARIELFLEDIETAQAVLEGTRERLEELLPVIEDVDPELALSLPRRLELIISGLPRDPETVLIDLELFTKDLLALEIFLFDD